MLAGVEREVPAAAEEEGAQRGAPAGSTPGVARPPAKTN